MAEPGLEPAVLRQWDHRVDELTGVTGFEGPGFHTPRQPAWREREASGRRRPDPRNLAQPPRVSQPQKIAGNCRRDLRKVS